MHRWFFMVFHTIFNVFINIHEYTNSLYSEVFVIPVYLEVATAVVVSVTSPHASIKLWYIFIFWSFWNIGYWRKAAYCLSRCQGEWEFFRFPLVLMNRLGKTKSADFLYCNSFYFLRIRFFFQNIKQKGLFAYGIMRWKAYT